METWRKRRDGLHVFCMYMEEKKMDLDEVFKARPDIILSNSLTWREKKGGKGALEVMKKLKTHMEVALSMFSDKRCGVITNGTSDNQRTESGESDKMKHGRLLMRKAMALLVAFSGARMTELAAIQRKDVIDSGEEITFSTIIRKGKKPRTRKIILRTRDGP
ncbi:MAG: hypothetical protein EZS28_030676 [Streblomastix strix]|uniref:Tyr recombinase domain-containing protein n=1 Tax=Streblomastix strix TaxID=222440 RepID=A0A5J4UTU6_9EUKA|nr:MAG: hypothetical protein EZS28_030676 [Streblomastix strix]